MNHKTALRWRHKVMAFLTPTEPPRCCAGSSRPTGPTFRRNFKGSKAVGRRLRKRGTQNGSKRGLGKDKVPVVVARARIGDTRAVVLPGTSNALALTAVFRPMRSPGVTLCTDGSSAKRLAAQSLGVKHVDLVTVRTSGSGASTACRR